MMNHFVDLIIFKENQFTLGFDNNLQQYYVSFPVPSINRLCDYEVKYSLEKDYLPIIDVNLKKFVEECRLGHHKKLKYQNY